MKIISWNVNSVRARITNILNYIKQAKPDILLLQEIKTQDENFPYKEFKKIGYESHVFGQKSYNGVAIISKIKVKNIKKNLISDDLKQSRVITGEIQIKRNKINLINIYVPNGNPIDTEKYEYKKKWLNNSCCRRKHQGVLRQAMRQPKILQNEQSQRCVGARTVQKL